MRIRLEDSNGNNLIHEINGASLSHDANDDNGYLTRVLIHNNSAVINDIQNFIDNNTDRDTIKIMVSEGEYDSNVNLVPRDGSLTSWILNDSNDETMIIEKRFNFVGGPGADQID